MSGEQGGRRGESGQVSSTLADTSTNDTIQNAGVADNSYFDRAPHVRLTVTDEPNETAPTRRSRLVRGALRILRPSIGAIVLRDSRGAKEPVSQQPRDHLDAAMQWLARAHDATGGEGVSAGYSMLEGWLPPYPETTGYLIPTLFDYSRATGDRSFSDRAIRMADWELDVQMPSGAIQGGLYYGLSRARAESVFNTGQVVLGWCRAYEETHDERYLSAAARAGQWLMNVQSSDGAWRSHSPLTSTQVHTYNSRTAWSLLRLSMLLGNDTFSRSAHNHLRWVVAEQKTNGWIARTEFYARDHRWGVAFTHTIAYVLEGLLESWRLTGCETYLQSCVAAAQRLRNAYETLGRMPGDFSDDWKSRADYACLTGSAQIAGIWMSLVAPTNDSRYASAAAALLTDVKATQRLHSGDLGIRGGIQGSSPVGGRYTPYIYPNWAAKFFADSVMREVFPSP